jgi:hypothetical protein
MKKLLLFLMLTAALPAKELYIIAGDAFPEDHLSSATIKAIFLDKRHLLDDRPLLPFNYTLDNPVRRCFEREILHKSRHALEHYWLRAHYRGKRPPKVIKSRAMLIAYLRKIPTAIGYTDVRPEKGDGLKILYRILCP